MTEQKEERPPEKELQPFLDALQKAEDLESVKQTLVNEILDVFQIEMAAIFFVDIPKQELNSWLLLPGDVLETITIPIGTNSIVGYVASTRQPINLPDPYDFQELRRVSPELNFSDTWDKKANIRSKQILAFPLVHNNTMLGVVELINKRDDTNFSYEEENKVKELIGVLALSFFTHGDFSKQTPPQYESLLTQNLLSREQLKEGLAKATESGEDPETVLMETFQVPRVQMGKLLANFYSTSFADLEEVDTNPMELIKGINIDYFEEEELVPLSLEDGKLTVAVKDIEEQTLVSSIRKQVPRVNKVELAFAFQGDIRAFWKRTREKYLASESSGQKTTSGSTSFDSSLVDDLLADGDPQQHHEHQPSAGGSFVDLLAGEVPETSGQVSSPIEQPQVSSASVEPQGRAEVKQQVIVKEVREQRLEPDHDIDAPRVVQMVNKIIERGYSSQASDIHIEPYGHKEDGELRYRIKGVCSKALKIPQQHVAQIIDRIKVLASLRRAERSRPQAGKIDYTTADGKKIELRVTTIPTVNSNEDIVIQLIARPKSLPPLDALMPPRHFAPFKELLEQKQGLILVVGPNSAGKTTTLHSTLAHLNSPGKKIWTAEYPLKFQQHGIRQVQVDPVANYTFAAALRAFRRADADVIMIGEMENQETAKMIVETAQEGNLLLSTLPADSAAEGINHCLDMGLDPADLAASLKGVLAQRLVRTLCSHCKEAYPPERALYDRLLECYGIAFFDHINVMYSDSMVFYRAKGCDKCGNSGYLGKTRLYELLVVNPTIGKLIRKGAPLGEIIEEGMSNDMTLLAQEGIQLVFEGTIDYKELMSTCTL